MKILESLKAEILAVLQGGVRSMQGCLQHWAAYLMTTASSSSSLLTSLTRRTWSIFWLWWVEFPLPTRNIFDKPKNQILFARWTTQSNMGRTLMWGHMILSQQRMALMLIGCWERGAEDFVGLLAFFLPWSIFCWTKFLQRSACVHWRLLRYARSPARDNGAGQGQGSRLEIWDNNLLEIVS